MKIYNNTNITYSAIEQNSRMHTKQNASADLENKMTQYTDTLSISKTGQESFKHLSSVSYMEYQNRFEKEVTDIFAKEDTDKQLFERLANSKFRSSFHLKQKDIDYINEKGFDTIRKHAQDFIAKREAPAVIPNDGRQTPTKGHPVFIAQHATATCCRECIRKWHKMQPGRELSQVQQAYLVDVIMTWIKKEMEQW